MCILQEQGLPFSLEGKEPKEFNQRDVRSLIFHFLYVVESFDYEISLQVVVDTFNREFNLSLEPESLIITTAQAVIDQRDDLDKQIVPLLHNWRFDRLGVSTKLILRYALWELNQKEISHNIIINEAIELAKSFAEKDAYKFINGILDEAVKAEEKEL